jgi:hypothetical protein
MQRVQRVATRCGCRENTLATTVALRYGEIGYSWEHRLATEKRIGMAHVRVVRHEAEQGLLPPVCVVCGRVACAAIPRDFSWVSKWRLVVGALLVFPGSLIAMVWIGLHCSWLFGESMVPASLVGVCLICLGIYLVRSCHHSMNLRLPFCARHRGYWRNREGWGFFLGVPFMLVIPSAISYGKTVSVNPDLGVFIVISLIFFFVLGSIASLAMRYTSIHESRIDEQSIILKNVSEEFARAVAEAHLDRPPVMSVEQERIQEAVPEKSTPEPIEPTDQRIQPESP